MVQDVMNAHLDESEIAGVETLSTEIAGVETLSQEIAGVETLSTEEKTNDAAAAAGTVMDNTVETGILMGSPGTGTVMDNTVDTAPLDDILDAETGADQKQGL